MVTLLSLLWPPISRQHVVLPRNNGSLSAQQSLPTPPGTHSEEEQPCPSPAGTPVVHTHGFLHHLPSASQKFAATIPCQGLCLQPCLNHAWDPLHQLHLSPRVNLEFHQNGAKLSPRKAAMTVSLVPTKRISAATKTCTFQRNSFRAGGCLKCKLLWLRRDLEKNLEMFDQKEVTQIGARCYWLFHSPPWTSRTSCFSSKKTGFWRHFFYYFVVLFGVLLS